MVYLEYLKQKTEFPKEQKPPKPVFFKTTIPYKGKKEVYYTYCKTHTIKGFGKQKLLISFNKADLSGEPKYYISNRLHWQASGISRIRRHRWPVEVFHEEGKAEGLDKYQLRNKRAIKRHIACVLLVYSILQCARHDARLLNKLQTNIKLDEMIDGSLAYWRRLSKAHAFKALVFWIFMTFKQGQSIEQVLKPLMNSIAYT